MRIATLAHTRHYGVPTFMLQDNIDVMMCVMRTSMGNKEPEVFRKNLADVKKCHGSSAGIIGSGVATRARNGSLRRITPGIATC